MAEAAQIETGLIAFLKADPAVAAASGGRVFGGELPAEETALMPRTALVIRASGGVSLTGESYLGHDTQRVDIVAFGPTPRIASELLRSAALALRQLRRGVFGGVLIHWANAAGGTLSGREPETDWPRAFQSFQVMHGLAAIEE